MDKTRITDFLRKFTEWAQTKTEISIVLLVGSQARGDARPDSDVDLVIICNESNHFLENTEWAHQFGIPLRQAIEDWGNVTSLRVWYANGLEVEFGITDREWIKEPLDEGAKRVIASGCRVLVDKSNFLSQVFDQ